MDLTLGAAETAMISRGRHSPHQMSSDIGLAPIAMRGSAPSIVQPGAPAWVPA